MEKLEPCVLLVEMLTGAATVENSEYQEIKHRITTSSSSGCAPERNKSRDKIRDLHTRAYRSPKVEMQMSLWINGQTKCAH